MMNGSSVSSGISVTVALVLTRSKKKFALSSSQRDRPKRPIFFFIAELAMTNRSAGQSELAVANPISEAG